MAGVVIECQGGREGDVSPSGMKGRISVGKVNSAKGFRSRKARRLKEEDVMG